MFAPPLRRPPFDPALATATNIKLDYAIYDFEYDDNDILMWRSKKSF